MKYEEELPAFVPADALERAVHQGDFAAMLASLQAMSAAERKSRVESLEGMGRLMWSSHWPGSPYARQWGGEAQVAQYRALQAATVPDRIMLRRAGCDSTTVKSLERAKEATAAISSG